MRRYESYKDSGVEWLGEIPSHWESFPLFVQAKISSITNHIDKELLSVYLDRGVVKFSDVDEKRTNVTSLDLSKYQLVRKGNLVLNNQQAWRGSVGISNYEGIVSPAYLILELSNKFDPHYANYLFRNGSMVSHYLIASKGVGTIQRNLYWGNLRRTPIFIPPLSEQQKIAQFLDDKTAKIDQAVDLAEKQIALLKEHKQILIQNAVTRGLNPDVPLKDSGVEWIGQVPEHWEVSSLGKMLLPVSEKNKPNLPLLSITRELGVIERDVEDQESNHNFIPDDLSNYKVLKEGQFGMNKMKAWQGSYGVSRFTGIVSPAYYIFDFIKSVNSRFFHWAIRSKIYISFFGSASDGVRIGQWDLSKSRMKSIPFIIPSYTEQVQIADYLDQQAVKIDQAIALKTAHIEKLKEYKSVLINDVVTGKVRVSV